MSEPLPNLALSEHLAEGVWHVTIGSRPLRWYAQGRPQCLPADWQGLLVVADGWQWEGEPADFCAISCQVLVKLQVFIDEGVPGLASASSVPVCLPLDMPVARCAQTLERWYVQQAFRASADYERFAQALRSGEEYWLVRYLLDQGRGQDSLQALARRYGVSVSHFRRLCRQALGGATKPALRSWRVARALLEVIDEGRSLTEVAQNQGYCSSSHFSRDVRELLGVPPSRLGDIVGALR
ncbi:helix-turn-helix domain-containing protein [Pseudomonas rubra]|uniref:Helix-turn-helix domain-containing protein n=1 Tax=Pseudomonas rubra TaxID=2942627 RepID=A0ABT5PCI9_9PSED|nr:helix-turn-helix domain-containing protein [Pseudomonas rubra]MDD1016018.1 helix-turn-helix domain-containing protein [Pseudomonas rubra]MDD1039211.1 helix-turn-helix domain-containing protein [Pseudomonas rubra]MDD1155181.1 helix-turn-helix domain-containing protein [Pseudomonas rubra]